MRHVGAREFQRDECGYDVSDAKGQEEDGRDRKDDEGFRGEGFAAEEDEPDDG